MSGRQDFIRRDRYPASVEEGAFDDIESARQDSRGQLKSRLEGVFQKYGKDFGGISDVVNFVTGQLDEDNGHLSRMRNEYDVGPHKRPAQEHPGLHYEGQANAVDELATPDPRLRTTHHTQPFDDAPGLVSDYLPTPATTATTFRNAKTAPSAQSHGLLSNAEMHSSQQRASKDIAPDYQQHASPSRPVPANTSDIQTATVRASEGFNPGTQQLDVMQQLGKSIAESLAKLLQPGGNGPVHHPPATAHEPKSIWDAPPLPPPPHAKDARPSTTQMSTETSFQQQDPYAVTSHYRPRSKSLWADDPDQVRRRFSRATATGTHLGRSRRVSFETAGQRSIGDGSLEGGPQGRRSASSTNPSRHGRMQGSLSGDSPARTSRKGLKLVPWTPDEDSIVLKFISHPEFMFKSGTAKARSVEANLLPRLPGRSLKAVQYRRWILQPLIDDEKVTDATRIRTPQNREHLVNDDSDSELAQMEDYTVHDKARLEEDIVPQRDSLSWRKHSQYRIDPTADISLIHTPSTDDSAEVTARLAKHGRWGATNADLGQRGTPWSAQEIKRLARLIYEQGLSLQQTTAHFPERGLNGVKSCWQRWREGHLDDFLRRHSIIGKRSISRSSSPTLALPMNTTPLQDFLASSPLTKGDDQSALENNPDLTFKRPGKRKFMVVPPAANIVSSTSMSEPLAKGSARKSARLSATTRSVTPASEAEAPEATADPGSIPADSDPHAGKGSEMNQNLTRTPQVIVTVEKPSARKARVSPNTSSIPKQSWKGQLEAAATDADDSEDELAL